MPKMIYSISLTRGQWARIDPEDYALVAKYRWFAQSEEPRTE